MELKIDCICKYGKGLPLDTKRCPKCGLNLETIAKLYKLSGDLIVQGDESFKENKTGLAVSFYHAAHHLSIIPEPEPFVKAIEIYINEKNGKLAGELLKYSKIHFPDEKVWNDLENRVNELLNEENEKKKQQQKVVKNFRFFKNAFYASIGILFVLVVFNFTKQFLIPNDGPEEKSLDFYTNYYNAQFSNSTHFTDIKIDTDSALHFNGEFELNDSREFMDILMSSDLPLSKLDINSIQIYPSEPEIKHINYIIKAGESLSAIAYSVYGDLTKWEEIYNANKDILKNPNQVIVGTSLKIPISN